LILMVVNEKRLRKKKLGFVEDQHLPYITHHHST